MAGKNQAREKQTDDLIEKLINVNRVAKVVKVVEFSDSLL